MSQELTRFLVVSAVVCAAVSIVVELTLRYIAPAVRRVMRQRRPPAIEPAEVQEARSRRGLASSTIKTFAELVAILVALNELGIIVVVSGWGLEGTVIDRDLSRPIPGVEVTVMEFSTLTDVNGNYSLQYYGRPRPEWRVKFTREGYGTLERTLTSDEYTEVFLETGHP